MPRESASVCPGSRAFAAGSRISPSPDTSGCCSPRRAGTAPASTGGVAVEKALEHYGAPVYVRKQIVHNIHVVTELEQQGAIFVDEVDEVPEGAHIVFSAHGVSPPS